jgi:hypothetical protein
MEDTAITCDVCGRRKQETNHWIVAIVPTGEDATVPGIAFGPIGVDVSDDPNLATEHLCGEACVHVRLSRWLDDLKASSTTNGKDT